MGRGKREGRESERVGVCLKGKGERVGRVRGWGVFEGEGERVGRVRGWGVFEGEGGEGRESERVGCV